MSLSRRAMSIQPVWLIDENAMILRSDVWFKPPIEPTTRDKIKVR